MTTLYAALRHDPRKPDLPSAVDCIRQLVLHRRRSPSEGRSADTIAAGSTRTISAEPSLSGPGLPLAGRLPPSGVGADFAEKQGRFAVQAHLCDIGPEQQC